MEILCCYAIFISLPLHDVVRTFQLMLVELPYEFWQNVRWQMF